MLHDASVDVLWDKIHAGITEIALLDGKKQRLVSPSGGRNSWLIDLRRLLTRGDYLDALADLFWAQAECHLPFQIGGMEVAAIPLLTAILMKSVQKGRPINGFIIRKERKAYGAGNLIEGEVTGDPIIIIDDIFNSGASAEKIFAVLSNKGHIFKKLFVVIKYDSEPGKAWSVRRGVEIQSFFTLKDFGIRGIKASETSCYGLL